jgi:hypothetical protein
MVGFDPPAAVMSLSAILAEAILSGRSDAIIAADRDGIIRFWNPGAERYSAIPAMKPWANPSTSLFHSGFDSGIGMATAGSYRLVTVATAIMTCRPTARTARQSLSSSRLCRCATELVA